MGDIVNKFKPKLTEEASIYISQRLGCEIPAKTIKLEVSKQFQIDISIARILKLTETKRWNTIRQAAHESYLTQINDLNGIALAAQRTRLKAGDKLQERLLKMFAKIEKHVDDADEYRTKVYAIIDNVPLLFDKKKDKDVISQIVTTMRDLDFCNAKSSDMKLMKELRDTMEIYLKVLKMGKDETSTKIKAPELNGFNKFMAGLKKPQENVNGETKV